MKPFLILRIPVTLSNDKKPERRDSVGHRPEVAGEASDARAASALVASLSFGDYRHHYYALELRFSGAPDRKSAISLPLGRPARRGNKPKLLQIENKEKRA